MYELAHNINGETFTPPETAVSWGAKKMKERGAPEVAYARNGLPAQVPIEGTLDMLRSVVTEPGRYRLDPMDEHGHRIEGAQPAYVQVPTIAPVAVVENRTTAIAIPDRDLIVAEAIRHNTELARAVVDRFPEMMHAAAELLRAADGAGLPARVAAVQPATDATEDDDGAEKAPKTVKALGPFGIDLNAIIAEVAKDALEKLTNKLPSLSDMTDWGDTRAKPKAITSSSSSPPTSTHAVTAPPATDATPQPDANQMRQMMAIYTQLSSAEAKLARHLIQELTPVERQQWIADLSTLPVPDAVAKVRAVLGTDANSGAAS